MEASSVLTSTPQPVALDQKSTRQEQVRIFYHHDKLQFNPLNTCDLQDLRLCLHNYLDKLVFNQTATNLSFMSVMIGRHKAGT